MMTLTPVEALDVIWSDHEDWIRVSEEVNDHTRWSILKSGIFQHKPTNKHYQFHWSEGATEIQDETPFQYEKEVKPIEVKLVSKTIEVWEKV